MDPFEEYSWLRCEFPYTSGLSLIETKIYTDEERTMFEKAARMKLRFSYYGSIGAEDLWDLGPNNLNDIYTAINHSLKEVKDEGLMTKKDKKIEVMELQLAIVKHVYETKVKEAEEKEAEVEKLQKRRRINEIIARKQESELEGKSVEELASMRDAL